MSESADMKVREMDRRSDAYRRCLREVMQSNPQLDERDAVRICERRLEGEASSGDR